MTIPEVVRDVIGAHLRSARSFAKKFAVHDEVARIDAALAWLDAQPAAPTERWKPVEPDMDHPIMDADGRCMYWTTDDELVIEQDYSGNSESIVLPDNLRLCRRVEVQP